MNLVEALFAIAIAAVGTWMIVGGFSRGVIHGENGYTVSRIEKPIRFWLEMTIGVAISAGCVGFALWRMLVP